MAQKSFPAHPRSRFANPIPRPHCSSQARLYNAPTLSLTFGSRTTRKRQRCIFPPLGAQTPASRIRRIDSFGPTAVELDDGTRRPRPDNQLRMDCRLHAPRLPERARRDRREGPVIGGHHLKSLAARPPKISALIVAIGSKVPPARGTISRCRRCSAIRVERCPMETIVVFGRTSISIR